MTPPPFRHIHPLSIYLLLHSSNCPFQHLPISQHLHQSISPSIYPCIHPSICRCVRPSPVFSSGIHQSLYPTTSTVCPSVYASIYYPFLLSINLVFASIHLSLNQSFPSSIHWSINQCIHPAICLSISQSIHHRFICPSTSHCMHPSVHPPFFLSMHSFVSIHYHFLLLLDSVSLQSNVRP